MRWSTMCHIATIATCLGGCRRADEGLFTDLVQFGGCCEAWVWGSSENNDTLVTVEIDVTENLQRACAGEMIGPTEKDVSRLGVAQSAIHFGWGVGDSMTDPEADPSAAYVATDGTLEYQAMKVSDVDGRVWSTKGISQCAAMIVTLRDVKYRRESGGHEFFLEEYTFQAVRVGGYFE